MSRLRMMSALALVALAGVAWAAGSAGDLDTGFDSDGIVVTTSSPNGSLWALAAQSDGKIVAVGSDGVANAVGEWCIRRYLSTGALDTGFGSGGEVRLFGDWAWDSAADVAIDSSGRMVVVGDVMLAEQGRGNKVKYSRVMAAVRLDSAGDLDTTFGDAGIAYVDITSSAIESAAALQIDTSGRIVIAGAAVRLTAAGALDTNFAGGDGYLVHDLSDNDEFVVWGAMGLQSDGSIVVGSRAWSGSNWTLTRYTSSGSVDSDFGTVVGASGRQLNGLAIQSDDKIVIAGYDTAGDVDAVVVRYSASGSIDTSFATNGVFHSGLSGRDEAAPVAIQSDGKIVVGLIDISSSSEANMLAVRLTSSGSYDSGFGVAGISETVDLNEQNGPRDIVITSGGRIVLGGGTSGTATDWDEDWLLAAFLGS